MFTSPHSLYFDLVIHEGLNSHVSLLSPATALVLAFGIAYARRYSFLCLLPQLPLLTLPLSFAAALYIQMQPSGTPLLRPFLR